MKKKILLLVIFGVLLISLSGCVPNDGTYSVESPAGFLWGLWHGIIAWISFFMGLFTDGKYTIYEAANTGWGYNLGFLIGISTIFGGGGSAVRKSKSYHDVKFIGFTLGRKSKGKDKDDVASND